MNKDNYEKWYFKRGKIKAVSNMRKESWRQRLRTMKLLGASVTLDDTSLMLNFFSALFCLITEFYSVLFS